jgi:hypothetical protein
MFYDWQTAVLKESLWMSPGVASPLPCVVLSSGASIHKIFIPGGVRKRRGARIVQAANQSNRVDGGWNEQPLCAS